MPLWSQIITPAVETETIFRLGRVQQNADYLLPVFVCVLLAWYFWRRYRIDAGDLKRWQRILLYSLRVAALLGLLIFYLHPQWEHLAGSSSVAVLIDSSSSMSNRDEAFTGTNNSKERTQGSGDTPLSRFDAVFDYLKHSPLLETLTQKHTVRTFTFDSQLRVIEIDDKRAVPNGNTTALGAALHEVLRRDSNDAAWQPLAGIIVFSDGQQNTGQSISIPLETASNRRIPIHTVGLGKSKVPANIRLGSIDLPERIFPNDTFKLKVPVEWTGDLGDSSQTQRANVLLYDGGTQIGEVAWDDKQHNVQFDVKLSSAGKHKLSVRITPPPDDENPNDNQQTFEVDVVDRKDRILLFASAPTRDYQFLCSLIYRDKTMEVNVLPGWESVGISQNADKILTKFPSTRAEMSQYDVVIAFDPNWRELAPEQIDVLEYWTARQGGGLIIEAGGIHQADTINGWLSDKAMDKIRAMYPVEFLSGVSAFNHRLQTSAKPSPVKLTSTGESAAFLQPFNDSIQSRSFWNTFPGFYAVFNVKGVKPAAALLATLDSGLSSGISLNSQLENAGSNGDQLVEIAEQFYGNGRVLYFGSGELWRLRQSGEKVFEQVATKMIRYVSQGRLQRDSDRGSLTTDKQRYSLGAIAQLRITANDAQLNPLSESQLAIEIQNPSGAKRMLDAQLDPNVPGTYQAFVPLTEEGTWLVQLALPDSVLSEQQTGLVLKRSLQVQISDLEREHPNRDEQLLKEIASKTGGIYCETLDGASSLPDKINVRSQRAVLDQHAEERLFFWLLTGVCALILLEWTLRRLMRLA
ncbi:hypothetical protein FACS189454_07280 [Planctomycetales bacterium]|nr:hypothetical protein FACS189454_07280 [Planctomycetales bacterium]